MSAPDGLDLAASAETRGFKNWLVKKGFSRDVCAVDGCPSGDTEVTEILPLDPIDHEETVTRLCPEHQEWASERNDLAERVLDELREARKEIGEEYFAEVQRLANPTREPSRALLMGEYDTVEAARRAEQ